MATKKELDLLFKLQDISLEFDEDGEVHPLSYCGTYSDGVADCLRLLLKQKTLTEIINK